MPNVTFEHYHPFSYFLNFLETVTEKEIELEGFKI